jgi:hypothetical protein
MGISLSDPHTSYGICFVKVIIPRRSARTLREHAEFREI